MSTVRKVEELLGNPATVLKDQELWQCACVSGMWVLVLGLHSWCSHLSAQQADSQPQESCQEEEVSSPVFPAESQRCHWRWLARALSPPMPFSGPHLALSFRIPR